MKRKAATYDWDPGSMHSFWINHASRLLMRQFEARLRPLEFGMAYLPVVMALHEAGEPLLQKNLAERAHVEQPTMAALLTRMERDGLIAREPHPTDRRATLISLTDKAKKRLPVAMEQMSEVAVHVTDGFTEKEKTAFFELLRRADANLDALE